MPLPTAPGNVVHLKKDKSNDFENFDHEHHAYHFETCYIQNPKETDSPVEFPTKCMYSLPFTNKNSTCSSDICACIRHKTDLFQILLT